MEGGKRPRGPPAFPPAPGPVPPRLPPDPPDRHKAGGNPRKGGRAQTEQYDARSSSRGPRRMSKADEPAGQPPRGGNNGCPY